jgi:hypothetical protein
VTLAYLRRDVANRLEDAGWDHIREAWGRRRDPLGPHALLLLYAGKPVGDPPISELHVSGRVFLAGDEPKLPHLLYDLNSIIGGHLAGGHTPHAYPISSFADPGAASADYVGLAVSSLDTPQGTWTDIQATAWTEMDIPMRGQAMLIDGSRLQVDVFGRDRFGEVQVTTSEPISGPTARLPIKNWHRLQNPQHQTPDEAEVWRWMTTLHTTLLRGTRAV